MSKRAEEAAMRAYPDIPLPHLGKNVIAHCGNLWLAYQEGYEQAEKDIITHIREQIERWTPVDWAEHFNGERVAFRSVLNLLNEMEEEL